MSELATSSIKVDSMLDQLLRSLTRLYTVLTSLTKHFLARVKFNRGCVRDANFQMLVKKVGNELTMKIYDLISHIQVGILKIDSIFNSFSSFQ